MKKLKELKPKRVTQEELKLIKGLINAINQAQLQIGSLEVQKKTLVDQCFFAQDKLNSNNSLLKEKYGDVSVNIQDGSLKTIPKNESN